MARKVLPRFSLPLQPSAYPQPGGRRACATPGQARPSASRVVPSVRLPEPLRCVPGFLVLAMLGSAQGRPAPFHSSSIAASVSPAVSSPKPCCSHEKDREHAVRQARALWGYGVMVDQPRESGERNGAEGAWGGFAGGRRRASAVLLLPPFDTRSGRKRCREKEEGGKGCESRRASGDRHSERSGTTSSPSSGDP